MPRNNFTTNIHWVDVIWSCLVVSHCVTLRRVAGSPAPPRSEGTRDRARGGSFQLYNRDSLLTLGINVWLQVATKVFLTKITVLSCKINSVTPAMARITSHGWFQCQEVSLLGKYAVLLGTFRLNLSQHSHSHCNISYMNISILFLSKNTRYKIAWDCLPSRIEGRQSPDLTL